MIQDSSSARRGGPHVVRATAPPHSPSDLQRQSRMSYDFAYLAELYCHAYSIGPSAYAMPGYRRAERGREHIEAWLTAWHSLGAHFVRAAGLQQPIGFAFGVPWASAKAAAAELLAPEFVPLLGALNDLDFLVLDVVVLPLQRTSPLLVLPPPNQRTFRTVGERLVESLEAISRGNPAVLLPSWFTKGKRLFHGYEEVLESHKGSVRLSRKTRLRLYPGGSELAQRGTVSASMV